MIKEELFLYRTPHRDVLPYRDKRECSSEPYVKPSIALRRVLSLEILMNLPATAVKQRRNSHADPCKSIIGNLAVQLDRVTSKIEDQSFLSNVQRDNWTLEESQFFILKWAEELKSINVTDPTRVDKALNVRKSRSGSECRGGSTHAVQRQVLAEAQEVCSEWTRRLRTLPKDSVCVREEHKDVIKDLCKQWKRGQLSNMLPVMDFMIKNTLQENKAKVGVKGEWQRVLSTLRAFVRSAFSV